MVAGLLGPNFIKIIERTIGSKRLFNAFYLEPCENDGFAWFHANNVFYIVELKTGIIISWEGHMLRNNKCTYKISVDEYYRFFNDFEKAIRNLEYGDEDE